MKILITILVLLLALTSQAYANDTHQDFKCSYDGKGYHYRCINYTKMNSTSENGYSGYSSTIEQDDPDRDIPGYPYCLCYEATHNPNKENGSNCDWVNYPVPGKSFSYASYESSDQCKMNHTPICGNFALTLKDSACEKHDDD